MAVSSIRVDQGAGPYLHTWQRTISAVAREDQFVLNGEPPLPTFVVSTALCALSAADSHLIQLCSGSSTYTRVLRIWAEQAVASTSTALHQFQLWRISSAGTTGTAYTPAPLDTADTASATAMTLPSSKGTESTRILTIGAIVSSSVANGFNPCVLDLDFDGPRSKPLIIPSGTAYGIVLKNVSTQAAGSVFVNVLFTETAWL